LCSTDVGSDFSFGCRFHRHFFVVIFCLVGFAFRGFSILLYVFFPGFFCFILFVSYLLYRIFIYLFAFFVVFAVHCCNCSGRRRKDVKEFENEWGNIYCILHIYIVVCGGGLNLFAAPAAKAAALAAGQELIALSVCQPEELGHKQQLKQSFPRNRSHTRKKYA